MTPAQERMKRIVERFPTDNPFKEMNDEDLCLYYSGSCGEGTKKILAEMRIRVAKLKVKR